MESEPKPVCAITITLFPDGRCSWVNVKEEVERHPTVFETTGMLREVLQTLEARRIAHTTLQTMAMSAQAQQEAAIAQSIRKGLVI